MAIEETFLAIAVYDGKYTGGPAAPTRICRIEGSVVPYDRPRYSLLEEALKVLELCADKYSTPRAAGKHITVIVDRERSTGSKPLMRLDISIDEGHAVANIAGDAPTHKRTATVDVDSDDDVATIIRKVLMQL